MSFNLKILNRKGPKTYKKATKQPLKRTSVLFSVVTRRGKKVWFSNLTFTQERHVEDVEHELGPRGRLGSHRRSRESLRNRKISNRRKLRIAPEGLSGGGEGGAPAKIN